MSPHEETSMNIDPMEIEDSKNTEAKIQGSGYQQEPIGDHHEVVVGNLLPLVLNDKAYSQTNTPFERRNWRPISGDNAKTRNGIKDICDSGGRRLHIVETFKGIELGRETIGTLFIHIEVSFDAQ
ncbi:hypothetical protein BGX31_000731 [Mortierella sp. GBA43]|nr:hypothetical protein BGX31_000731 [Mortierella sp. GBA43]